MPGTTGGASFDAAGNELSVNGDTIVYDAENRQVSATDGVTRNIELYSYDGNGLRVQKSMSGGTATMYVYDVFNQLAAEYSDASASSPCATCYLGVDHLGSTRLVMDPSGNVVSRHDFLPFGEEIAANTAGRNSQWGPGNDSITQKFTGKERDSESGLDYFGARYYASNMGRFMSPDWSAKAEPVPYSKLDNPQSLNLYSYVLNNPLSNVDTDGHACESLYFNTGSGFCTRATEYGQIDVRSGIQSQTRFFAAANAVSQALADVATPISGIFVSSKTSSFLEGVGQNLQKLNESEANAIQNGSLSGPNLDQQLVHNEQSSVQGQLNSFQQSDPTGYTKAIGEINGSLNGTVKKGLEQLTGTDRAYAGVLA